VTTIGLCTHFSDIDEVAFEFAFNLAKKNKAQLNICHWLNSPYTLRRDIVGDDLFNPVDQVPVTPELLTRLEYQLRAYYETKLGDFTDVAFKLCEGNYQVELHRCFHQHLLDLVVMGYVEPDEIQPIESFAAGLSHPLVIVKNGDGPKFLLNNEALKWMDFLALEEGSWEVIQLDPVST
jgi:hypothetical protein